MDEHGVRSRMRYGVEGETKRIKLCVSLRSLLCVYIEKPYFQISSPGVTLKKSTKGSTVCLVLGRLVYTI